MRDTRTHKSTETNSTPKHSRTRTPEDITDSRNRNNINRHKKNYLKHQDTSTGKDTRRLLKQQDASTESKDQDQKTRREMRT